MKKFAAMFSIAFAVAILLTVNGCAVYTLATAPDRTEVEAVKSNMYRAEVIAQFGQPAASGKDDLDRDFDTFSFKTGSTGTAKLIRGLWYGLTDLASLGIMEILWTPIEGVVQYGRTIAKTTYDSHGKVIDVKVEEVSDLDSIKMNSAKPGMHRTEIIAYYGNPLASEKDGDGRDFDVFPCLGTFFNSSSMTMEKINMKVTYDNRSKVVDASELKDASLLQKIKTRKEQKQ